MQTCHEELDSKKYTFALQRAIFHCDCACATVCGKDIERKVRLSSLFQTSMGHSKDIAGKIWCFQPLLTGTTPLETLIIQYCKIDYHPVCG